MAVYAYLIHLVFHSSELCLIMEATPVQKRVSLLYAPEMMITIFFTIELDKNGNKSNLEENYKLHFLKCMHKCNMKKGNI